MTVHEAAQKPFSAQTKAKVVLTVQVEVARCEQTDDPALTLADVGRSAMDAIWNAIKAAENRGHTHTLENKVSICHPQVGFDSVEYLP